MNWLVLSFTAYKNFSRGYRKKGRWPEKAKDRITVNACANVTGDIKVPLLFIGKAKNPSTLFSPKSNSFDPANGSRCSGEHEASLSQKPAS